MTYLFISPNGEYPRYQGDVLLEYPDFDGVNLPEGWKAVTPTDAPIVEAHQIYEEIFPELINGEYVQSWLVKDLTQEEIDAFIPRPTRGE